MFFIRRRKGALLNTSRNAFLKDLARELNRAAEAGHTPGRPFVTVSYAQSIDGSIATRRRRPLPISGPAAMHMTHGLRALHDAILVGIETVLADDPQLTARLVEGPHPQAVVLDTFLRTPLDARLLQRKEGRPWLVGAVGNPVDRVAAVTDAGAEVLPCRREQDNGRLDLKETLGMLHARGIRRLMVEGGARVITSFVRAQLVDLFIITIAPKLVGGLQVMTAPPNGTEDPMTLTGVRCERLEDDLVLWARPDWRVP
jgi:3,4-dihydroxy 2-butanone 4-phosphate synthase/GTP cyclohydrolase II